MRRTRTSSSRRAKAGGLSDGPGRAAGPRGAADRHDHDVPARDPALLRQADRASRDLRRPGGHRDRERAAVPGAAGAHAGPDALGRASSRRSARSAGRSARRSTSRRCSTPSSRASQLAGTDGGAIYEYDEATEVFHLRATQRFDEESFGLAARRRSARARARSAARRDAAAGPDPRHRGEGAYESRLRDAMRSGRDYRALLAVPLLSGRTVIGGLVVNRGRRPASSPRRSSTSSRPSPPSRRSPSRTPASSARSRTRAGSSRRPAATSPSSSPTCPTSCGRR